MKKRMTKLFLLGLLISMVPVTNIYAKIKMDRVSCGNITGIPAKIPELVSFAITLIQIAVPVILVVMGSIDLFKGITAQKDDEIKKGQQMFVKRLLIAALIFFVIVIAKFLISIIADNSSTNIIDCIDCFMDDKNCKEE